MEIEVFFNWNGIQLRRWPPAHNQQQSHHPLSRIVFISLQQLLFIGDWVVVLLDQIQEYYNITFILYKIDITVRL